jgi:hypothetical protein
MIRLLRYDATGTPILEEFSSETTPPYASLSHTWSTTEEEECSKKDVEAGTWYVKPGSSKILFCLEQALQDGLEYVWIDTCCINNESSAELSEAINSMFKWYKLAAKCYVYLSDVAVGAENNLLSENCDPNDELVSSKMWKSAFLKSRWFTRGWTLQELLAPTTIDFFSKTSTCLGTKQELLEEINHITGIPKDALRGGGDSLANFSVDERLSWARNRKTKREEDEIYSLLGIVDVSMAPIYGEGRVKARKRLLREIRESQETADFSIDTSWGSEKGEHNANSSPQTARCEELNCSKRGMGEEGPCRSRTKERTSSSTRQDSVCPKPHVRMAEAGPTKDIPEGRSDHGHHYVNYGGTQINNIGKGNQFNGDFTGLVNFA